VFVLIITYCVIQKSGVFENRVLRRIFGTKDEVKGSEEDFIMRSCMICTAHPILCG
jgi:hypothetical protein